MPKNILLITSRADIGGGPLHVYNLLKGLRSKNYQGKLYIACPNHGRFFDLFKALCDGHFEIPNRAFRFISLLKLLLFIQKNKIDVIHSHGVGAGFFSRLLYPFGIKVIHSFHGIHRSNGVSGLFKHLGQLLLKRFCDYYVAVSNGEKRLAVLMQYASPGDIKVIANGIDSKLLIDNFKKHDSFLLKKKYAVSEKKVIGFLGRNDSVKNIDKLIEKFKKAKTPEDLLLVIAGDSTYLDKKTDVQDVKYLGEFEDPSEFYSLVDIYCSHSSREGLPTTVLESLALGIPVLISDVIGHRDFSDLGYDILLFDPNNLEDFCTQLERALGRIGKGSKYPEEVGFLTMCDLLAVLYDRV